jgi:hypothetical protein
MELFSPGEIVKRMPGATTRAILDLAEKGLVIPAKKTTGAGSARLYDFYSVFQIAVCLAIRGRIPAGTGTHELIRNILDFLKEETIKAQSREALFANEIIKSVWTGQGLSPEPLPLGPPPVKVLFIGYDDGNHYFFSSVDYGDEIGSVLARSSKYRPQNFCTYFIEVGALWNYLKRIF